MSKKITHFIKDGHKIPVATYKVDTTLVDIKANTFVDSTGTITV